MGHTDPRMFNKAYKSQIIRFNIQTIFLGYKNQISIILIAGDKAHSRDPYAPKKLFKKQHLNILNLPEIR